MYDQESYEETENIRRTSSPYTSLSPVKFLPSFSQIKQIKVWRIHRIYLSIVHLLAGYAQSCPSEAMVAGGLGLETNFFSHLSPSMKFIPSISKIKQIKVFEEESAKPWSDEIRTGRLMRKPPQASGHGSSKRRAKPRTRADFPRWGKSACWRFSWPVRNAISKLRMLV